MDAKLYLNDYIVLADKSLDLFFTRKIKEVEDIGIAVDMLNRYREFCHGGKKLRGALIQLGFEITGGDKDKIISASTSIEIIHSFLLMHDDIEDRDDTRRGKPTIHKQYANTHTEHYGISMGINTGDLGYSLGLEVLLSSKEFICRDFCKECHTGKDLT